MLQNILKWMRHYKGFIVSIVLISLTCLWSFGCESKVKSMSGEGMVSRAGLKIEVEIFARQIELKIADLDGQDAVKQELFNIGLVIAEGGIDAVNPIGAAINIAGILGLGLIFDNRKKDALLKGKTMKNKT